MNIRFVTVVATLAVILSSSRIARADETLPVDENSYYKRFARGCVSAAARQSCAVATAELCEGEATATATLTVARDPQCFVAPATAPVAPVVLPWANIIADFFVARAKAELAQFLKDRIADKVCDPDKPATALLTETCRVLAEGGSGLTGIPGALRRDLYDLPTHLFELGFQLVKIDQLPAGSRSALCIADAAIKTYPFLRDKGPLAALHELAIMTPREECKTDKPLIRLLVVAAALEKTVRDVVPAVRNFPSEIDRVALLNAAKAYLAEQRDRLQQLCSTCNIDDEIKALTARIEAGIGKVELFVSLVAALERVDTHDPDSVARVLDQLADLLAALLPATDASSDVVSSLRAASSFASGKYASGMLRLTSLHVVSEWLSKHEDLEKVWNGVVKFAALIGSLAEAKNETDAREILEAATTGVSYREYRQGGWAAFVAGYAGINGGFEFGGPTGGAVIAPLLPVGVEFGRPLGESSSFNIVSLLDVGALAARRLTKEGTESMGMDGNVKTSPQDGLAAVLAPGLFLGFGLGDSPFLLGAGFQFLPASRSVFDCPAGMLCESTRTEPVFRGLVFVAMDLPVFAIYR